MMIRFIPIGSRPPRKLLWRLSRAKPVLASPGDVLKPVVALARLAADAGKSAPRRFILGAQVDGAAVGAGRSGLVAEALIGEPSGGPGLGILRVVLHRELVLILALIQQTAIVIGLGIVGTKRDGPVEILQRLLRLLLRLVDEAAAEIGRRVIGIERDRAFVVGHRLVEPPGLAVDQPAIGVGLPIIGVEADRLVEIGERLFGLAGLRQHRAARVVDLRIAGIVLDGLGQ